MSEADHIDIIIVSLECRMLYLINLHDFYRLLSTACSSGDWILDDEGCSRTFDTYRSYRPQPGSIICSLLSWQPTAFIRPPVVLMTRNIFLPHKLSPSYPVPRLHHVFLLRRRQFPSACGSDPNPPTVSSLERSPPPRNRSSTRGTKRSIGRAEKETQPASQHRPPKKELGRGTQTLLSRQPPSRKREPMQR